VREVGPGHVTTEHEGARSAIAARTVLWAAGVQASPVGGLIAAAAGVELDRSGRIAVAPDLSVPGHPEIFVVGDLAAVAHGGKPLPAVAQVAMQQGRHAASTVEARLEGRAAKPFRYRNLGNMATIGRSAAVADLGPVKLSGFVGWIAWLTIHILNLERYENRVLVLVQWAWNYFTWNRSARLITGGARAQDERHTPG
jgi:NADH dehydrogenase